jgi:hypothetical protein
MKYKVYYRTLNKYLKKMLITFNVIFLSRRYYSFLKQANGADFALINQDAMDILR